MLRRQEGLSENNVVDFWLREIAGRRDLVTEEGSPVRVMYPGRMNDDRGADLLDAVIATNTGTAKGDVEVHVKSSGWWLHHHHENPAFNRVILHVVFWKNTQKDTNLQNGKIIPTIALSNYIGNTPGVEDNGALNETNWGMPCSLAANRKNIEDYCEILDKAGEARFLEKAGRFMADLAGIEARQVLYQGMMTALGYVRNKIPFQELARRLPLSILESVAGSYLTDEECLIQLQAMLLGTAGLLPSQSDAWQYQSKDSEWTVKLEKAWACYPHKETMSGDDWHLFKVRPSNFPARRIAAMSHCILSNRERGILAGLLGRVKEARGCHELERMLLVPANGYWARHFDFGPASRMRGDALLGSGRASVIAVNIFLPFTFAWGRSNSQPELAEKALDIYRHCPQLAANIVERHMQRQLRMNGHLVNSAQQQQGLLHIYQTLCTQGKCCLCPLAR